MLSPASIGKRNQANDCSSRNVVRKKRGVSLRHPGPLFRLVYPAVLLFLLPLSLLFTGCGNAIPGAAPAPTVTLVASPSTIAAGSSSTLTVSATHATQVVVTGSDGSSHSLQPSGGTVIVNPAATTTYTASAGGPGGQVTAVATVTVSPAPGPTPTPGPTSAPTVTISASPASISAGSSSALIVAATNATQVTVTGTDGSSYTLPPSGGTQPVSPSVTTTYTATATGAGGKTTATVTVTVAVATAAAPTVSISANPTSINAGSSSTLTVTATNATQVTVTGTDGSTHNLPSNGGTVSVTPAGTTSYTATATGAGGKASANATVTVGTVPAPTVTLTANPTSIAPGSSSVLTVAANNAATVTLTGTDGSKYVLAPSGGKQTVSPTATTTYTATAAAGGVSATANATVTVVAPVAPTVSIAANPTTISSGASSTLTVTASNATQVTVTGSDGSSYTLQPTGGTPSVSPAATTTYTATATGPGGHVTATTTVTVEPDKPTVTVTANPTSVDQGSSSILTVTATHATQVTLTGSDGSSYTLSPSGGTESVDPSSSTTYTATATGAGGTVTATQALTVQPNPKPTVTITASPSSIHVGSSSTLTVGSSYANQVTISGSDGSSYSLTGTSGTQSVSPTATTTYTATATGSGGSSTAAATVTVQQNPEPTVTIAANPTSVAPGNSATLTVTATNATAVTITGTDNSSYSLPPSGGTQSVTPSSSTTYTATATGGAGTSPATAEASVTVVASGSINSINHVIFMLQENHTFDNYFGMLNPYRAANGYSVGDDGVTYTVDGIDDKLTTISNSDDEGTSYSLFKFNSTCIDDETSNWLASFGDVNTYNFLTTRPVLMDGFVHNAEGFAKSCAASGTCSGTFTDLTGQRSMGYYDQGFLNYYYYMASQFAVSDRWFSPVASKSVSNRIATDTGGTTQGLIEDPGTDNLGALNIETIFQELTNANVSWKIYYSATDGFCTAGGTCSGGSNADYPALYFTHLTYAYEFVHANTTQTPCTAPTQPSSVVGDTTNSFCIDPTHIAPVSDPNYGYFADLNNSNLPSFAFIEAGYGINDEHPGSTSSVLIGQQQVANIVNAFMASPQWKDSVFFLGYDEGGGPYDHVPPVPNHTNDFTDASQVPNYPTDISSIAVNPDSYNPCLPPNPPGTPTLHCDLVSNDPGANTGDAAAQYGFAAQLGFRVPNMVISPFTRRHYVSHIPMDHTAVIKFVENRFIGPAAHLTNRDNAQPNLLDFFDFNKIPWATPPSPPAPNNNISSSCTPTSM